MRTKFWLSFLTLTSLSINTQTAQSQTYQPTNRPPVSDNTLGTQITGNGNNFNITGGINRGQTLFHSFTDFSVPTNGQANFLNPVGNRDIITRVTGNLFSDINGTVNTNGANFFLINPNGIVFGTNAQLNVGKAFVGSTANSIDLVSAGGRITFGTNSNGDAPLLSVAPNVLFDVSRLNIGGGNGAISNFGTLFSPNLNQYIGLIGGNVTINGGRIFAPGGRVELGGLSAPGTIGLGAEGNNLKFNFPSNIARGDASFINKARVNVVGFGGGDIVITSRNLEILGGSTLFGGIETGFGTPKTVAGDIKLNATGKITIVGSNTGISNDVGLNSKGNGGNITVDADSLTLSDGALLSATTAGQGNAGNITVKTKDAVSLSKAAILSTLEDGGVGKSGNIDISAASLSLQNGAQLLTITREASDTQPAGQGNTGDINVKVTGAVNIAGKNGNFLAGIRSTVNQGTVGNGGNINIDAGSLSLNDRAQLQATTFGQGHGGDVNIKAGSVSLGNATVIQSSTWGHGNAGNITVTAKDAVSLSYGYLLSTVEAGGVGNGGTIDIKASSLSLKDGAELKTVTHEARNSQPAAQGNAGNIKVKVTGAVDISGRNIDGTFSGIRTDVGTGAKGNGGNIAIEAASLSLLGGNRLQASSYGQGNAGNISVNLTGNADISGIKDGWSSGIFSFVGTDAKGNGGNISIDAASLSLLDSGSLIASTFGQGNAGSIFLNGGRIVLNNGGIFSQSNSYTGGNITIKNTDYLLLRNDSSISTNSYSTKVKGDGGNIAINSPLIVALPGDNDIAANAYQGAGGRVNISSQGLFGIKYRPKGQDSILTNDITASSAFGQNGSVNITTPGTDPGKDSSELPKATTDASKQISQVCSASSRQNKLTVTGRGGLPPNANEPLTSDVVWQDARAASSQPAIGSAITNPAKLAHPAVGFVFDGKGKVTLVAAATQGQPTGTSVACPIKQ